MDNIKESKEYQLAKDWERAVRQCDDKRQMNLFGNDNRT